MLSFALSGWLLVALSFLKSEVEAAGCPLQSNWFRGDCLAKECNYNTRSVENNYEKIMRIIETTVDASGGLTESEIQLVEEFLLVSSESS